MAVCCCKTPPDPRYVSRNSLSSRVFSIAITACLAKLANEIDLLVGEWPNLLAVDGYRADQLVFLQHRDDDQCAGPREIGQRDNGRSTLKIRRVGPKIRDLDWELGPDDCSKTTFRVRMKGYLRLF